MNHSLSGKTALVTGGSRGIGAAIAKRLAQDGAAVALTYAGSEDKARGVVQAIEALGGRALAIQADSADPGAVCAAIQHTVESFGRFDILVNNAGIAKLATIGELTLEDFDRIVAVNVRGVFVACLEASRVMADGGRIITIGSVNADHVPFQGGSIYGMSKAAVAGLTRGLARDLGPRAITVNVIQPGPIDTDMNPADGAFADTLRKTLALDRYGRAEEIAALTAYLAGPEAGFMTGASLTIDGGFSA